MNPRENHAQTPIRSPLIQHGTHDSSGGVSALNYSVMKSPMGKNIHFVMNNPLLRIRLSEKA